MHPLFQSFDELRCPQWPARVRRLANRRELELGFGFTLTKEIAPSCNRPLRAPGFHRKARIRVCDSAMSRSTGPRPLFRFAHQACANRVTLRITQRFPQVRRI